MHGINISNYTELFWAIDRAQANTYLPVVGAFLDGKLTASQEGKEKQCSVKMYQEMDGGQPSKVAVIPISGPIVRYSDWYNVGTTAIAREITAASNDPDVTAIILQIDSPGGSVAALPVMKKALEAARDKKTIYAHVAGGMICSAAYYIASFAHEIHAEFATDCIGSIGTMCSWLDFEGFWEKQGAKAHEVYATESTEKNLAFRQAKDGDYEKLRSEWLDVYNKDFHDVVTANREARVNPTAMKGAVYFVEEALSLGLIDGQSSFEEILTRAAASGSSSNTQSMFGKKTAVATLLATAAAERTEEQFSAAIEELNAAGINVLLIENGNAVDAAAQLSALAAAGKTVEQLTQELSAANASLQASKTAFDGLSAKLKAYAGEDFENEEATVDALVEAASKESAHQQTTSTHQEGEASDVDAVLDALPHNQKADQNF